MKNEPHAFSRRAFFQSALAGTAGAAALAPLAGCSTHGASQAVLSGTTLREPSRDVPVRSEDDVVVCGAGPAGVAAALAAARAGARTRLFDVNGCLGGVWTAGLLTWIFDFDKPGLAREISQKLDARGARHGSHRAMFAYEPEEMKVLLEEMCEEAGVRVRLQTRVAAAHRDGQRLSAVVTESSAGREAWRAPVFIDATGDGDLGAQAGCGWDIGNPETGECQPLTLNALAAVRDASRLKDYLSCDDLKGHVAATRRNLADLQRAGIDPSYHMPTVFPVRDNVVLLMFNHEYGVKPYDADAMTAATLRARREVYAMVRGLRKLGGVWEGLQLVATAEQIGIRDGRRIRGRYTVVKDDLITGARHADAVARVTFGVDIHAATHDKNKTETIGRGGVTRMLPYDIPLRALLAKDADGLLMAGRCISGDFVAHASYRVTGNSVATGEAAGAVAALAAKKRCLPHEVEWSEAMTGLNRS
jgi:glycine/D-amino acid oxidase-like deaminating enzyme